MTSKLIEIFNDEKLIDKIKSRLPHSFQLAELESSRAGKIGVEVGSLRLENKRFGSFSTVKYENLNS